MFCFGLAIALGLLVVAARSSRGFFSIGSGPATNLGCQNEKMFWTLRKMRLFSVSGLLTVNKRRFFSSETSSPSPTLMIIIDSSAWRVKQKTTGNIFQMYSFEELYSKNSNSKCNCGGPPVSEATVVLQVNLVSFRITPIT